MIRIRGKKDGRSLFGVIFVLALWVLGLGTLIRFSSFPFDTIGVGEDVLVVHVENDGQDLPRKSDIPPSRPTYCTLSSSGKIDTLGNFVLDDPSSCPWVDYAGNVLVRPDDQLTPEERGQKERLVGSQNRSILLIGDSQERNTVTNFCGTVSGSQLTVPPPRWTQADSTVYVAPQGGLHDMRLVFRVCRIQQLTIASFFNFGFISGSRWADNHVTEDEPREIQDRIDNILPKYLEDVFGKDFSLDAVVLNSGLWDLVAISFYDDWEEKMSTLNQTNNHWHMQANAVANSLEAQVPDAALVWRNLPNVAEERSKKQVYGPQRMSAFTFDRVKVMNDVGESFAESRQWPILDWRGPLLPLGSSALQSDGFHVDQRGWKLLMNRILNAVMEHQKVV